jgi:hypothetical protein
MPIRNRPPTGLGATVTRQVLPANLSEKAFQTAIMDLAAWYGWRRFHPRTVQVMKGAHLTPYLGEAGFPDLVLVHRQRGVIFAELKAQKGRPTAAQELWRADLEQAGAEYHLWRPSDWWSIEKRLRGDTPT